MNMNKSKNIHEAVEKELSSDPLTDVTASPPGWTLYALEDLPAASSALLEAARMIASRDQRLAGDTLLEA